MMVVVDANIVLAALMKPSKTQELVFLTKNAQTKKRF